MAWKVCQQLFNYILTVGFNSCMMTPTMKPCDDKQSCLIDFEEFLSMDPKQTQYWDHKCNGCVIGTARKTEDWTPEDGNGSNCLECFGPLPTRKKSGKGITRSGYCRECASRKQTNHGNQSKRTGVKAYWGYREVAHKIVEYNDGRRKCTTSVDADTPT